MFLPTDRYLLLRQTDEKGDVVRIPHEGKAGSCLFSRAVGPNPGCTYCHLGAGIFYRYLSPPTPNTAGFGHVISGVTPFLSVSASSPIESP